MNDYRGRYVPRTNREAVFAIICIVIAIICGLVAFFVPRPAKSADLPVQWTKDQRAAVRELEFKKRMTRRQFERSLQSPIGRGRLE